MTLQLASKLGYESVAYSRSISRLELAKELGATHSVLTCESEPYRKTDGDLLLDSAVVFAPEGSVALRHLVDRREEKPVNSGYSHECNTGD